MPKMPFIGVRISWLMLARNWLLASLAASAFSFELFYFEQLLLNEARVCAATLRRSMKTQTSAANDQQRR